MKNNVHPIFFVLVAMVFCISASRPICASEPSASNDELLEEYTELARAQFFLIYDALWIRNQLDEKVNGAVNKSFAAHTEKFLWGTRNIQLSFNTSGVLEAIRTDVLADFLPFYKKFLVDVQKEFADAWHLITQSAYKTMVVELLKTKDPVLQTFLRIKTEPMLAEYGKAIDKRVSDALPEAFGIKFDIAAINEKAPYLIALGFRGYMLRIFDDMPIWLAGEYSVDLNEFFARDVLDQCWERIAENIRKGLSAVLSDREILLCELDEFVTDPKTQALQQEYRKELENIRSQTAELVNNYFAEHP